MQPNKGTEIPEPTAQDIEALKQQHPSIFEACKNLLSEEDIAKAIIILNGLSKDELYLLNMKLLLIVTAGFPEQLEDLFGRKDVAQA